MVNENKQELLQKRIRKLEKEIAIHQNVAGELKESEKRYTHFFEHSPVMVYRTDKRGKIVDINQSGVDLLGYSSRKEIIGMKTRFFYADPEDRVHLLRNVNKFGFVRECETSIYRKDGTIINVQVSAVQRNINGSMDGYEGFVLDITGRKKAERALIESEEKYRTVAENSLAAIFIHHNKRFCYANQRFVELLGYDSQSEILGKAFWAVVHPDDRQMVKERGLRRTKKDFFPHQYSFRALKKDGAVIWVELRAAHASYMGQPSVIGNFIDITQSRQAEEEIRLLTQRLIEAGEKERKQIAADIHDEFGQALTSLHFDLEAMQRSLPREAVEQINKFSSLIASIEKLADFVRKTTSYIRPDVLDHLGLIPALEWYVKEFIQRHPDNKIKMKVTGFKKRLSPEKEIFLYRFCQECLTNIHKHAQATSIKIMLTSSYPWVIFVIKDNGIGFQQSKSGLPNNIKTHGIGLQSMKEIVASLRGNIDIISGHGKGTSIRIELPFHGEKNE
jgi:PAS domain S-box-containing protein